MGAIARIEAIDTDGGFVVTTCRTSGPPVALEIRLGAAVNPEHDTIVGRIRAREVVIPHDVDSDVLGELSAAAGSPVVDQVVTKIRSVSAQERIAVVVVSKDGVMDTHRVAGIAADQ